MIRVSGPTKCVSPDYKFELTESNGEWHISRTIPFDYNNLFKGFVKEKNLNERYIENNYNISYYDYEKYITFKVDVICPDGKVICLNDLLSSYVRTIYKEQGEDGRWIFYDYFPFLDCNDVNGAQVFWRYYRMYDRASYFNTNIIQELLDQRILVETPAFFI